MNIYDDVNNLVANLKNNEKTKRFKEIRKGIKENNPELFEKIEAFQKLNVELSTLALMEGEIPEDKKQESKKLYDELTQNEKALEYFTAEIELNQMLEEVNGIFMNGIREIYAE